MPQIEEIIEKLEELKQTSIEDLKFSQQSAINPDDYDKFINCLKGLPRQEISSLTAVDIESLLFWQKMYQHVNEIIEPENFSVFYNKFNQAFRKAESLIFNETKNIEQLRHLIPSSVQGEVEELDLKSSGSFADPSVAGLSSSLYSLEPNSGKEVSLGSTKKAMAFRNSIKENYKTSEKTGAEIDDQKLDQKITDIHDLLFKLVKSLKPNAPLESIETKLTENQKKQINDLITNFINKLSTYISSNNDTLIQKGRDIQYIATKLGIFKDKEHYQTKEGHTLSPLMAAAIKNKVISEPTSRQKVISESNYKPKAEKKENIPIVFSAMQSVFGSSVGEKLKSKLTNNQVEGELKSKPAGKKTKRKENYKTSEEIDTEIDDPNLDQKIIDIHYWLFKLVDSLKPSESLESIKTKLTEDQKKQINKAIKHFINKLETYRSSKNDTLIQKGRDIQYIATKLEMLKENYKTNEDHIPSLQMVRAIKKNSGR